MKKKTKYSLFIGIPILIIITISFIFFPQKKRFDEYLCKRTGWNNEIFIIIDDKNLIIETNKKTKTDNSIFSDSAWNRRNIGIKEETKEKIVFEWGEHIFYKRTKKLKITDAIGEREPYLLDCTKLN